MSVKEKDPDIMNATEAAQFLGISRVTMTKWIRDGKVPCRKASHKRIFFSKQGLRDWAKGDSHKSSSLSEP